LTINDDNKNDNDDNLTYKAHEVEHSDLGRKINFDSIKFDSLK